MDASHSPGKKRVVLHSSSDGQQVSEGVVVGMVSGSANAHGWMPVGHYFKCLVKGNSPPEVS